MDVAHRRLAIARLKSLPTLPAVVGQILSAVDDPHTSALDLGVIISNDQSLAANMLKLVNSAAYTPISRVTHVSAAVATLGFAEVRNLVLTVAAFSALPASGSGYARTPLWRHALTTAVAVEQIVRTLKLPMDSGLYTAGLLHDIGKVALDTLFAREFYQAVKWSHEQSVPLIQAERDMLGIDHVEAGTILSGQWHMPELVRCGIKYQEEPLFAPSQAHAAMLVALADYLSTEAGYLEALPEPLREYPAEVADRLGFDASHREKTLDALRLESTRVDAFVGAMV